MSSPAPPRPTNSGIRGSDTVRVPRPVANRPAQKSVGPLLFALTRRRVFTATRSNARADQRRDDGVRGSNKLVGWANSTDAELTGWWRRPPVRASLRVHVAAIQVPRQASRGRQAEGWVVIVMKTTVTIRWEGDDRYGDREHRGQSRGCQHEGDEREKDYPCAVRDRGQQTVKNSGPRR